MSTPEQRVAALAATGQDKEKIAAEAGVSYPTLLRFARGESIHTANEKKIISVIHSYGWEMRDGGVLPIPNQKQP